MKSPWIKEYHEALGVTTIGVRWGYQIKAVITEMERPQGVAWCVGFFSGNMSSIDQAKYLEAIGHAEFNYEPTPEEMKILRENWVGEFPASPTLRRLTVKEIWG